PDEGALLGGVLHCANVVLELRRIRIAGYGDDDFDVVGRGASFKLRFGLNMKYD
uniref:Porin family protein n=1 Tax=Steinernema glaseri TaxID=37863 RepID=A0A1I7YBI2_9BILA